MNTNEFKHLDGNGLRIAIVASRFNQAMTDAMLTDCLDALSSAGVRDQDIVTSRVPGSFELPVVAAVLAKQNRFDAIVCLGVIIKGETRHDQFIADAVTNGLTHIAITHSLPVILGVVTAENIAQAQTRTLGGQKKGWEAGMSAVETALAIKNVS